MVFYDIFKYFSSIGCSISILCFGYNVWKYIKNFFQNRQSLAEFISDIRDSTDGIASKSVTKVLLVLAFIGLFITEPFIHQLVGVYNLKLLPSGTYCFYVEAIDYSSCNTYVLPAQIHIEKETEEVGDNKSRTYTYYYIEKVYFTNGGYLDTDYLDDVEIGDLTYYYDDDDNEWEITLLNKHAYSPYIEESNNANWVDITFFLIKAIPTAIIMLIVLVPEKKCVEED